MSGSPERPIDVYCGEPLTVTVPVLDASGARVAAGSLASAKAQIRVTIDADTVLHEWTTTGGSPNAAISPVGVTLTATAVQTQAWQDWTTDSPVWDLVVTDTGGAAHRLCAPSPVMVHHAVTR